MASDEPLSAEVIASRILVLRGQRVLLDADLALLYGVTTKRLNEQVKRNADRFPTDFAFRLSPEELRSLDRSQIATALSKHRDRRMPPAAFTEHGALMAAAVLNTPSAVAVSLEVVRAFVRLRQVLSRGDELVRRVASLERRTRATETGLRALAEAFDAAKAPGPQRARRRIGFTPEPSPPDTAAPEE